MISGVSRSPVPARGAVQPAFGALRRSRAHSSRDSLPQSATRHPQVGQREQRVQLRRVLRQPAIPDLDVAELAFDDAKRMLDLGADSGLDVLDLIRDGVLRIAPVEQAAQAGAHGNVPARGDVLRVLALVHALVARIGEHFGFLPMHQRVRLGDVVDVGRAVPTTVCTSPLSASTPMLAFIPKCH